MGKTQGAFSATLSIRKRGLGERDGMKTGERRTVGRRGGRRRRRGQERPGREQSGLDVEKLGEAGDRMGGGRKEERRRKRREESRGERRGGKKGRGRRRERWNRRSSSNWYQRVPGPIYFPAVSGSQRCSSDPQDALFNCTQGSQSCVLQLYKH